MVRGVSVEISVFVILNDMIDILDVTDNGLANRLMFFSNSWSGNSRKMSKPELVVFF